MVEGVQNWTRKWPLPETRKGGDLRRIFSKAVEWNMLRKNPTVGVSDPHVEHVEKPYLTDDEMERLHDALVDWEHYALT